VGWQPLSVRQGTRPPDGPYEGAPTHLRGRLLTWLYSTLRDCGSEIMYGVIMRTRAPVDHPFEHRQMMEDVFSLCSRNNEFFLDVIDAYLHLDPNNPSRRNRLREFLAEAGSAWTVAPDGKSLQRAVQPEAQAAFEKATSTADLASGELAETWSMAYGRTLDASDAWDHAIKAVEAILIPIVCPAKDRANLGSVAGDLKAQPQRFSFGLQGSGIGGVETLEAMLRLMWPNPDRHGGGSNGRVPTIEEARAVVHLAVTIVQWGRDGHIMKR
jgi:hypothetical protein